MKYFPLFRQAGKGMRVVLLLAMLFLSLGQSSTVAVYAAAPDNDDFGSAIVINKIEFHDTLDTREATPSDEIPNVDDPDNFLCEGENYRYGFASVWYQYTPPEDQALSLNTQGTTPASYDTFIAVWTGDQGALTLVPGACNDDNYEGVSELSFVASGGTTYYIEVAQYNDGLGSTSEIGGDLVFNAYISNTEVNVKNVTRGRYFIEEGSALRKSLINLNSGPVRVKNLGNNQIIAAERVIYKVNDVATSFSEMMGLPNSQLDSVYWLPWYNNKDLNTQLRFGNVSETQQATIHVTIGGVPMPGSPFNLAPGASVRKSYVGVDKGAVKIESNIPIVAAERVIYSVNGIDTSYSEMMAMPDSQLDTIYWMPWYNNKDLDTQLRFGNVSDQPATVTVTIGGIPVPGSPFALGAGKSIRKSFPGVDRGPVKIQSNVPIVAAERVIYKVNGVPVSFSEMMGLPDAHLSDTYWLPWYNNKDLNTQLRVGNVSASNANVQIFIAGDPAPGGSFTLLPGKSKRIAFLGIDKGPVQVVSNVNIVAAERVIYKVRNVDTSFSEMMGLSNSLLDSIFWMPWYNNVDLDSQLRFALP